jgi:sphingomyelin phosphodiesterase
MSWLYNTLASDYWSQWITSETAKYTFRTFGYYSEMVNPKLKLIALNSNVCYRLNFWIAYDSYDPDGQLAWLISELDEAESKGLYAMIIG